LIYIYVKRERERESNHPFTSPASAVRIQISKDLHRFLRISEPFVAWKIRVSKGRCTVKNTVYI
jgi:hypothetical protein